ncbi:Protein of unknown function [Gryllus bimaculatus]|nr:Protein of unknown function [Gryllus bimaculatus]
MQLALSATCCLRHCGRDSRYQGNLFMLMTNIQYYPEINTIEDLANVGYEVLCFEYYLLLMFKQSLKLSKAPHVHSRILKKGELETILEGGQRSALIFPESWWIRRKNMKMWQNFRAMKDLVEERLEFAHARRNWPWTVPVNNLYLKFDAYGLRTYWRNDFWQKVNLMPIAFTERHETMIGGPNEDTRRVFVLDDLRPHLQVLALGLILASLLFCLELYWKRREFHSNKMILKVQKKLINKTKRSKLC